MGRYKPIQTAERSLVTCDKPVFTCMDLISPLGEHGGIDSKLIHSCAPSPQDKVRCVEGSREFLQALGFISAMLPVDGQGNGGHHLIFV